MTTGCLNIGDVISINLAYYDGITPKNGYMSRRKYFVVLGICNGYAMLGGIVINSAVNRNLPKRLKECHISVSASDYPFLDHDSFFDCSILIKPRFSQLETAELLGKINDLHLEMILNCIKSNVRIPKIELEMFNIK